MEAEQVTVPPSWLSRILAPPLLPVLRVYLLYHLQARLGAWDSRMGLLWSDVGSFSFVRICICKAVVFPGSAVETCCKASHRIREITFCHQACQ